MSNWRARVDEVLHPRDNRDDRANKSENGAIVPNHPIVLPLDPVSTLAEWHEKLAALDFDAAPEGFTLKRWRQLCYDSWFIYEGFASQFVRDHWTALDVFGVLPWREGGGVLLDRLQGARNLKLDGEGRAFWSHFGVTFHTSSGIGEGLYAAGLVLLWDLKDRYPDWNR